MVSSKATRVCVRKNTLLGLIMPPRAGELQVTGENRKERKKKSKSGASAFNSAPSWSHHRLPGTRPGLPSTAV